MAWWWLWMGMGCGAPVSPWGVATFNIENFPRSDRQVQGAFAEIRSLELPVVALQEVTDPAAARAAASAQLGPAWRFVTHEGTRRAHRVGLLYDGSRMVVTEARAHDDVRVTPGGRPALEVALRDLATGNRWRVFVVHLKAGKTHWPTRQLQLERLTPRVRRRVADGERLVVLGDFNSVTDTDARLLDAFASGTGLSWLTQALGCTVLHPVSGARCEGRALDHVFSTEGFSTESTGPCAESCRWEGECPSFSREVSDHCPVVAR